MDSYLKKFGTIYFVKKKDSSMRGLDYTIIANKEAYNGSVEDLDLTKDYLLVSEIYLLMTHVKPTGVKGRKTRKNKRIN
jgi:hypothetical protein